MLCGKEWCAYAIEWVASVVAPARLSAVQGIKRFTFESQHHPPTALGIEGIFFFFYFLLYVCINRVHDRVLITLVTTLGDIALISRSNRNSFPHLSFNLRLLLLVTKRSSTAAAVEVELLPLCLHHRTECRTIRPSTSSISSL